MKKKKSYSQVLGDLETMVERMNQGEIPIDELGASVRQASEMIAYLRENLQATEMEITTILKNLEEPTA